MARRSPPKQKLRPAPVSTTARTAALRAQASDAASRSMAICRLSVLALSGRLSVTSATAPRVSTCTVGADMTLRLLVRRDTDAQPGEFSGEVDLAGQARVLLVVRKLREQLLLIRHHRRQPRAPRRVDVHVAGGTGAHAAADRGHAVVELAQILHHLEAGLGL